MNSKSGKICIFERSNGKKHVLWKKWISEIPASMKYSLHRQNFEWDISVWSSTLLMEFTRNVWVFDKVKHTIFFNPSVWRDISTVFIIATDKWRRFYSKIKQNDFCSDLIMVQALVTYITVGYYLHGRELCPCLPKQNTTIDTWSLWDRIEEQKQF